MLLIRHVEVGYVGLVVPPLSRCVQEQSRRRPSAVARPRRVASRAFFRWWPAAQPKAAGRCGAHSPRFELAKSGALK